MLVNKSIKRHQHNLLRRVGHFNAGKRRGRQRALRVSLVMHPFWGLIGPMRHGEHRNWRRKRMRDKARALLRARTEVLRD